MGITVRLKTNYRLRKPLYLLIRNTSRVGLQKCYRRNHMALSVLKFTVGVPRGNGKPLSKLPEWFYQERGETSQNRSRSKYDKTGGVRSPHQGSDQRVTSPRISNYSATASNASGFKKRQLAGRKRNSR